MSVLPRVEFGDPILRRVAPGLRKSDITSVKIQRLIKSMRQTLLEKKLGVGLAAPQVGQELALAVIAVRPTKHRPKVTSYDAVIINPKITNTFGRRAPKWEGCLSAGKSGLFAKVPRFEKVEVSYTDEHGKEHTKVFAGLQAQVVQHEIDHLNGILFVDRVRDTSTYMTLKEYKNRIVSKRNKDVIIKPDV